MSKKYYGLSNDYLFKKIFGRNVCCQQLLNDIFHKQVSSITYLNKEFKKENQGLSYGICDVLLKTRKSIILLEMQNRNLYHIEARISLYIASIYLEYWEKNDYGNVLPVEVCLILNYPYGDEKTLKEYQMLEVTLKERFGNYADIKVWNLRKALKETDSIHYQYAQLFCLNEYSSGQVEKILEVLSREERFKNMIQQIREYNMSKEEYQKMREEENMEMTFEQATSGLIEHAKEEGKKSGEMIGKRKKQMEIARNLLSEGFSVDLAAKVTKLSKEQVMRCQKFIETK